MEQRIIIRHLGADARTEEFPVASLVEAIFGREAGCTVHFDPGRDEMVSRATPSSPLPAATRSRWP